MTPTPAAETACTEEALAGLPNQPAVFVIHPRDGLPFLGRTTLLRRRMLRLLRSWKLAEVAARVQYWLTASRLEALLVLYEQARKHHPEDYLRVARLRMPAYVRVVLSHRFPRTTITSRLAGSRSLYFGPFRSRMAAEQFDSQFLDLFQIRRCPEDFEPSPSHPGCIYGEMNMCLRPCQAVVGDEEYASETARVVEFLSTGGRSLLDTITAARDRFSTELNFEEAARQHKRLEKIHDVLKLRDDLAAEIGSLSGVAVAPALASGAVDLRFLLGGCWLPAVRFGFEVVEGKPVSMDRRLRDIVSALEAPKLRIGERQEHLALLARWYYASWRDGEWLPFDDLSAVPYRKMVNAIHRIAAQVG